MTWTSCGQTIGEEKPSCLYATNGEEVVEYVHLSCDGCHYEGTDIFDYSPCYMCARCYKDYFYKEVNE